MSSCCIRIHQYNPLRFLQMLFCLGKHLQAAGCISMSTASAANDTTTIHWTFVDLRLWVQLRALDKKANKVEKMKNKKGGHNMWTEVHELGQLIRYFSHAKLASLVARSVLSSLLLPSLLSWQLLIMSSMHVTVSVKSMLPKAGNLAAVEQCNPTARQHWHMQEAFHTSFPSQFDSWKFCTAVFNTLSEVMHAAVCKNHTESLGPFTG